MIDIADKIVFTTVLPIMVRVTAVVVTKFLVGAALKAFIATDARMSKR